MPRRSKAEAKLPHFDLKAARESKGLTQGETAELLFADQGSVSRWEADGRLPLIYRKYWALYWQHNKTKRKPAAKRNKRTAASADVVH